MWWFIFSRTVGLVWEEWGKWEKKEKTFTIFWVAVITYLIGLAVFFANRPTFSEISKTNPSNLVFAIQYAVIALFAGPFIFAGIFLAIYFFINVLWCIIFPIAGIQRLLNEEERISGRMFIPFNEGDE